MINIFNDCKNHFILVNNFNHYLLLVNIMFDILIIIDYAMDGIMQIIKVQLF